MALSGWHTADVSPQPERRFLKLDDVAEMFSISSAQAYALVRRGDLRAIKLGGRGQWRVELVEVEAYIERAYSETSTFLDSHPFVEKSAARQSEPPHTSPGEDSHSD